MKRFISIMAKDLQAEGFTFSDYILASVGVAAFIMLCGMAQMI